MRSICLFVVGFLAMAVIGCGGVAGVKVGGKVVKNGAPHTLSEGEGISVNMVSSDGKASWSGQVQKDGSFTFGESVPAGKYSVNYVYYQPATAKAAKGGPTTPTSVEIKEPWQVSPTTASFTLDIGKN